MVYRISKNYFNALSEVYDRNGRLIDILPAKEVIRYLNKSAGFISPITDLQIEG